MLKRSILAILSIILVVGLVSCGGKESENTKKSNKNKEYAGIYTSLEVLEKSKSDKEKEKAGMNPWVAYYAVVLEEDGTFLSGSLSSF